jgi:hypothetical protein
MFFDDFDTLSTDNWEHEITLAGGGNWEFQAYTHNRSNRYFVLSSFYFVPGNDIVFPGMIFCTQV